MGRHRDGTTRFRLDERRDHANGSIVNEQDDVHRIRNAIDATDDAILELVERRLELARSMALAKRVESGGSALRPAREAFILDRLKRMARSAGPMLIDAVWRELIGQGRHAQGPMKLVLFTSRNPQLLEECARRHFSSAIPVEWAETQDDAMAAARREPAIAVVDGEIGDPELTFLCELRTLAGEALGCAYARVTADAPQGG